MMPALAFFACLLTIAVWGRKWIERAPAVVLLLLSGIGIVDDWRHPRFRDLDFASHAARFAAAPSGEEVRIPINPDWEMKLIKK
jgi:hypothetical protein